MTQMDYFSWPTSRFNTNTLKLTHSDSPHPPPPPLFHETPKLSESDTARKIDNFRNPTALHESGKGRGVSERDEDECHLQIASPTCEPSTSSPQMSPHFHPTQTSFVIVLSSSSTCCELWRHMQTHPLPKEPSPSPHFPLIQYRVEKLLEISPPIRCWDFCSLSD